MLPATNGSRHVGRRNRRPPKCTLSQVSSSQSLIERADTREQRVDIGSGSAVLHRRSIRAAPADCFDSYYVRRGRKGCSMNVCGLVAVCSLLLAPASGLNPPKTDNETAPMRVFRADTPGLTMPVLVKQSDPKLYTREDQQAGVQGAIVLEVTIGPDGRVRDAMITDGLPNSPAVEDRAVIALSEWRFQPGMLKGRPVAVRTTITFTMSLR